MSGSGNSIYLHRLLASVSGILSSHPSEIPPDVYKVLGDQLFF